MAQGISRLRLQLYITFVLDYWFKWNKRLKKILILCYYSAIYFFSELSFITLKFECKDCKVFIGTSCIRIHELYCGSNYLPVFKSKPYRFFYVSHGIRGSWPPGGQGRSHMSWVGKSSTFLIFSSNFDQFYFPSNFTYFLPHFDPLGGRLAHPGRPWLRHGGGGGGWGGSPYFFVYHWAEVEISSRIFVTGPEKSSRPTHIPGWRCVKAN